MAYDEALAGRVRERLEADGAVAEKKVFGAVTFLLQGNARGRTRCIRARPRGRGRRARGGDRGAGPGYGPGCRGRSVLA